MKEMIEVTIDNIKVKVQKGTTILQAAKEAGIKIPTLCYLKDINCEGACRVCVVENKARGNLITSCNSVADANAEYLTSTTKVLNARKKNVELLLSNHDKDCLSCGKNLKCKLQSLSRQFGCNEKKYEGSHLTFKIDDSNPSIIRNNNKCILCNRCIAVCKKVQATSAIAKQQRGFETSIGCAFDKPLKDSTCIGCGQCVLACPTGALLENSNISKVLTLLDNKDNYVVAQVAPAVRVAIGEEFGLPMGTFAQGQMATALKMLGFKKVLDVNTGADFTIIEEGKELIEKVKANKNLPLLTSCCPGWYAFVEKHYPNYVDNISTAKTPNEMLGALIKNHYLKNEKPIVVSIMPCTAKKHEILRRDDVDVVLTTRELAALIKMKNIEFSRLANSSFDNPLADYSSGGLIFGATGGVTEAALRFAAEVLNGKPLKDVNFKNVRNSAGIKEATIAAGGIKLKICVVNGLQNADKVMKDIVSGKKHYHFIEVMACPGGCVNGGGQPFVDYSDIDVSEVIKKRTASIFNYDKKAKVRSSQDNPVIKQAYGTFLTDKLAHEWLHRHK